MHDETDIANTRLRERLIECLALKDLPRAGWVRAGVAQPESVAAHSWGVALLVTLLCPDDLDRLRALEIALVHDLPEIRVGDITPHDGVTADDKQRREARAMADLAAALPHGQRLVERWREYDEATSPEARFVKACDKLDMALQAARYMRDDAELDLDEFVDSALARLEDPTLRALAGAP